jgi:hypothetical protein
MFNREEKKMMWLFKIDVLTLMKVGKCKIFSKIFILKNKEINLEEKAQKKNKSIYFIFL